MTRSTAPMSMPSSRLLVATTQRRRPDLSSSSTCARCSFETEPWWARASTGSAPAVCAGLRHHRGRDRRAPDERPSRRCRCGVDLVEPGGEPLGEAAGVGEHDRRPVLEDAVDDRLFDVRPDLTAARLVVVERRLAADPPSRGGAGMAGHVVDRHDRPEVERLVDAGGATISTGAEPPRNRATSSMRPHRRREPDALGRLLGGARRAARATRARCAPRLVAATACTSSTITVWTSRSVSPAGCVSIRYSDSGVVMRMSGGVRDELAPVGGGVSPERTPTRDLAAPSMPRRAPLA